MSVNDPTSAENTMISVCAWCKQVKQEEQWIPIESFVEKTVGLAVTHTICPGCYEETKPQAIMKPP